MPGIATRRGYWKCFVVIRRLVSGPALTSELSAVLGYDRNKTIAILGQMRTLKLLKRERVVLGQRRVTFRWSIGEDDDLANRNATPTKPGIEAITFAAMFRALQKPATVMQVATAMGVHRNCAAAQIHAGRDLFQAFPIVGFLPTLPKTPLYQFKPGEPDVIWQRMPREAVEAKRLARRKAARQQRRRLIQRSANASIFHLAQHIGRAA